MNFLQLVQRLRSEAGISGTGPITVINQTGEMGRLVNWVAEAYEDIQDKKQDWDFLRYDFSFNCTAGTPTYAQATVTGLANWKPDSFRIYKTSITDELYLRYSTWETFRDIRLRGAGRTTQGRPIEFSIDPRKNVYLWPIPDFAYTIAGEFFKVAQVMSADTDVPVFDRFHMAIVYNALMRYAAFVESPTLYAKAEREYGRLIGKLEGNWTPDIGVGAALA